jgi:tripartite-type tricarboxylate transporter receptor subunit TctC
MLVTSYATAAGRAKGGQVRALMVTGAARTPLLPEVPTMAEAGVADFVLGALFGIFVPAGTPREPIERLAAEVRGVTKIAEFRKRMVDIGQELTEPLAGEAFGRVMRAEAQRWRELAAKAGVKDE